MGLKREADSIEILTTPADFVGVSQFYEFVIITLAVYNELLKCICPYLNSQPCPQLNILCPNLTGEPNVPRIEQCQEY